MTKTDKWQDEFNDTWVVGDFSNKMVYEDIKQFISQVQQDSYEEGFKDGCKQTDEEWRVIKEEENHDAKR